MYKGFCEIRYSPTYSPRCSPNHSPASESSYSETCRTYEAKVHEGEYVGECLGEYVAIENRPQSLYRQAFRFMWVSMVSAF